MVVREAAGLKNSPTTIDKYRWTINEVLLPVLKNKRLITMNDGDAHELIQTCKGNGFHPATTNFVLMTLQAIMNQAVRSRIIPENRLKMFLP